MKALFFWGTSSAWHFDKRLPGLTLKPCAILSHYYSTSASSLLPVIIT